MSNNVFCYFRVVWIFTLFPPKLILYNINANMPSFLKGRHRGRRGHGIRRHHRSFAPDLYPPPKIASTSFKRSKTSRSDDREKYKKTPTESHHRSFAPDVYPPPKIASTSFKKSKTSRSDDREKYKRIPTESYHRSFAPDVYPPPKIASTSFKKSKISRSDDGEKKKIPNEIFVKKMLSNWSLLWKSR